MSDVAKKFVENYLSFKDIDNIAKEIEAGRSAKSIRNEVVSCEHPVAKKVLDWGHLKGKARYAREFERIVEDLLGKGTVSPADASRLSEKLQEFEEGIKKEIKKYIEDPKEGLRHLHAPGCVARREAMNLYFGEKYSEPALLRMGEQLLNSICVGGNLAVYFANENLRDAISYVFLRKFGTRSIPPGGLSRLRIYERVEGDKPYLTLLKFLLELYGYWEEETEATEKERLARILDLLKETEGIIYFTPGRDRFKYSTIPLPRLDRFFSEWLDVRRKREALKGMRDSLYDFMRGVEKSARRLKKVKEAQNSLELIAFYYDIFCADLLRTCSINCEALRRMVDLVTETSFRYEVRTELSFIRELT